MAPNLSESVPVRAANGHGGVLNSLWCATRRCGSERRWKDSVAGLSWQVGEVGGSLIRETPGRVGAAVTKSGRSWTTGRVGPGERDGTVYERNRCCKASSNFGQL